MAIHSSPDDLRPLRLAARILAGSPLTPDELAGVAHDLSHLFQTCRKQELEILDLKRELTLAENTVKQYQLEF